VTPRRTCVGCRAALDPETGVRVTRAPDGTLRVGRHHPGRGAWLCRLTAPACAGAAARRRAFGRALRAEVPPDAVAALVEALAHDGGVGAVAPDR
jgi:uncharacterized protein